MNCYAYFDSRRKDYYWDHWAGQSYWNDAACLLPSSSCKQRIIIPIPVLKTGASGMIAYRLHCKDLSFQYLQVTTNINLQYMQGTEKCKHPTLQPQKHHQPHCHHWRLSFSRPLPGLFTRTANRTLSSRPIGLSRKYCRTATQCRTVIKGRI